MGTFGVGCLKGQKVNLRKKVSNLFKLLYVIFIDHREDNNFVQFQVRRNIFSVVKLFETATEHFNFSNSFVKDQGLCSFCQVNVRNEGWFVILFQSREKIGLIMEVFLRKDMKLSWLFCWLLFFILHPD